MGLDAVCRQNTTVKSNCVLTGLSGVPCVVPTKHDSKIGLCVDRTEWCPMGLKSDCMLTGLSGVSRNVSTKHGSEI